MSTRKSGWVQGRALLIVALMLFSAFGVGISYGLTLNGTWSGDWFTEKYGNFTSGLKDEALTSGRVVLAGTQGLLGDDADLTFTGGDTLTVPNVSATNVYASSLYVNSEKYYPELPVSYTVWNDTLIYAKNGLTGAVTSNTNASIIINAVIAAGDSVFIKKGTYNLDDYISILHPMKLLSDGATFSFTHAETYGIYIEASNVEVSDLVLNGNAHIIGYGIGIDGNDVTIKNCEVYDMQYYGISSVSTAARSRIKILDNYIHDITDVTYGTGIKFGNGGGDSGGSGVWIERNTVCNVTEHGIKTYSAWTSVHINENNINTVGSTGISSSIGCFLERNIINNCPSNWAIYADGSGASSIIDNHITTAKYGIQVLGSNSTLSGNFIDTISNSYGIYIAGKSCLLSGNYIANCASWGVAFAGNYNVFQDNHIYNAGYGGINTAGTATGTKIYNNIIDAIIWRGITDQGIKTEIVGNTFLGASVISAFGTTPILRGNIGYVSENYGVSPVYSTNTTCVITHGLYTTPTLVTISTSWAGAAYVSAIGATTFTVTFTDPTATKAIYWTAIYKP